MFWENEPSINTPIDQIALNMFSGGWSKMSSQWTAYYDSADAPTFKMVLNNDFIDDISVGMKVKVLQGGVYKYFIVTSLLVVGFSIYVTMYGGTDYTLTNTAITSVWFSAGKAPNGFPMNPTKWTVVVTDTTQRAQASPVQNTWYNLGSVSINIPVGVWQVNYSLLPYSYRTGSTSKIQTDITLSTTTNSVTDASMSSAQYVGLLAATAELALSLSIKRPLPLALTSKTTYYLLTRTIVASITNLSNENAIQNLYITATCAYL